MSPKIGNLMVRDLLALEDPVTSKGPLSSPSNNSKENSKTCLVLQFYFHYLS